MPLKDYSNHLQNTTSRNHQFMPVIPQQTINGRKFVDFD